MRGTEESARAQSDYRESMADEVAHLRTVAEFVSAITGDSRDADLLAAAQRSGAECGRHILRMQKALRQMICSWPMC